jgi:hypothetical protein
MTRAAEAPRAFTADDYASRMARVLEQAREASLDGVAVAPGPDLVWLTGVRPAAITARPSQLVLSPGTPFATLIPVLERPNADRAARHRHSACGTGLMSRIATKPRRLSDAGGQRLNHTNHHRRVVG